MNEEQACDIWDVFKIHLDKKEVEAAAERYVDLLVDYGFDDVQLEEILGHDKILDNAIYYFLEMDEEDHYDEYEE
jgi:hypothetical protein